MAEFLKFTGLPDHAALRTVTRAHVIVWRKDFESRSLAAASIRRKLSALSSLFDYLCERNAVLGNPVDGVKRPVAINNEGSTPALGDASEPALHLGMLVGRVVVHDHVDLFTSRDHIIDHAQELQPFLMAVPVVAHRNHLALERVEGGEQRGRAMGLVVVGHGSAAAFLHWQAGLSAVQCLTLALFVGAQHQGMFGWIQIQADDVFQFLGKLGIAAELEGSHLVRLQPMSAPDAPHAASLIPAAAAMVRVLQYVALAGFR